MCMRRRQGGGGERERERERRTPHQRRAASADDAGEWTFVRGCIPPGTAAWRRTTALATRPATDPSLAAQCAPLIRCSPLATHCAPPTSPALQALVKAVLAYHIVPAVALSTQLSNGQKLPTLGGDAFGQLTVVLKKNGKVVIRGAGSKATVKTADVKVGASVVHIVGNVILPDLTKLA